MYVNSYRDFDTSQSREGEREREGGRQTVLSRTSTDLCPWNRVCRRSMFVFVRLLIAKGHALFEPMGERRRKGGGGRGVKRKEEKRGGERVTARRFEKRSFLSPCAIPPPVRGRVNQAGEFKPAAEIISKINHPSRSCSRHSPGISLIVVAPRLSRGKRIARVKKNCRVPKILSNRLLLLLLLLSSMIWNDFVQQLKSLKNIFLIRVQHKLKYSYPRIYNSLIVCPKISSFNIYVHELD